MKTITTYTAKTKKAAAILIVGLFLIQASVMASDSAEVNLEYSIEEAFDTEYEIENWMTNIHNSTVNVQATEEEMEVEDWMSNPQHSFWNNLDEAKETEMAVESWMANPKDWKITNEDVFLSLK